MQKLLSIYKVQSDAELIQCALKTRKVMKILPQLETLVNQVCKIVLNDKSEFDNLIPTLTSWKQERSQMTATKKLLDDISSELRINSADDIIGQVR